MEERDEVLSKKESKAYMQKDSIQFNSQDLDQEQNCQLNPSQTNTQNVTICIDEQRDLSSQISGTVFFERNRVFIANVKISLFVGNESRLPVCQTSSDENGNYKIEEIPPGYYTLQARRGDNVNYRSAIIKVMPCQNVNHAILLR